MKLENQVCTLEQAKKLKELLGEMYGLFVYMRNTANPKDSKLMLATQTRSFKDMGKIEGSGVIKYYPAFTVAELGVMLPSETLTIRRGSEDSEYVNWEWENESEGKAWGTFNTEAEARADHLIMLIQNNITTAEEINKRIAAQ